MIHIKRVLIRVLVPPKKIMVVRNLSKMISPYSLIKIKANIPPPYSMLNPDTISDSPSARSKGVRLDSAMHKSIHERKQGKEKITIHKSFCEDLISAGEKVLDR